MRLRAGGLRDFLLERTGLLPCHNDQTITPASSEKVQAVKARFQNRSSHPAAKSLVNEPLVERWVRKIHHDRKMSYGVAAWWKPGCMNLPAGHGLDTIEE